MATSALDRPRARDHGTWLLQHERVLYWACVAIAAVPLLVVERFPSQDGPVHLYIAHLMSRDIEGGALRGVFMWNDHIEPNSLIYYLLRPLFSLVSPLAAERLLVGLYWVGFAGAARYMSSAQRKGGVFAFLFLPFAFGYFLHLGFYNFSLATVLYMALAGFALRRLENLDASSLAVIAAGALLLAVTHVLPLLACLFTIGTARAGLALQQLARARTPGSRATVARAFVGDGLKIALLTSPALFLAFSFALRHAGAEVEGGTPVIGIAKLLAFAATLSPVHGLSVSGAAIALPYVVLVWTATAVAAWSLYRQPNSALAGLELILPLAGLALAYVALNVGMKGFSAQERLLPFVFFLLFCVLALSPANDRIRRWIVLVMPVVLLASAVDRAIFYRQAEALASQYRAIGQRIERGSTFVGVNTSGRRDRIGGTSTGLRLNVVEHLSSLVAIERDLVGLSTGLISTAGFGYFPIVYRPEKDPYIHLYPNSADPLIAEYVRRSGVPVEYVLFWPSLTPSPMLPPHAVSLIERLHREVAVGSGFRLVTPAVPNLYGATLDADGGAARSQPSSAEHE